MTILGQLGFPIGTVLQVEATLVADPAVSNLHFGSPPDSSPPEGRGPAASSFLLKVISVEGEELDQPLVMDFENRDPDTWLFVEPRRFLMEKRLRDQIEIGNLAADRVDQLVHSMVDIEMKLTVFETAAFRGIPIDERIGLINSGSDGMRFTSWLIIMDGTWTLPERDGAERQSGES